MRAVRSTVLTVVFLWLVTTGAAAQTLAVAAASDLQSALPAIAQQFEQETGHKVALTFGSSGNFFTQIQNGAPFDVLMSADIDYPRQLERAGLAERGSIDEYATGRIVLWTRNDSGIDLRGGLSVLASASVRRVAIANPEHAPYGRAAVAAIRHEQLYDGVKDKFVLGDREVAGRTGTNVDELTQSLNVDSGLQGLSGVGNDMRTVVAAAGEGNERARLALDVFVHRLSKAIAGLVVGLQRLDALVFTGGIGENSAVVRSLVLGRLGFLGLAEDLDANADHGRHTGGRISLAGPVEALVVPTDEELLIARDTSRVIAGG